MRVSFYIATTIASYCRDEGAHPLVRFKKGTALPMRGGRVGNEGPAPIAMELGLVEVLKILNQRQQRLQQPGKR